MLIRTFVVLALSCLLASTAGANGGGETVKRPRGAPKRTAAARALPDATAIHAGAGRYVYAEGARTFYRLDRTTGKLEALFTKRGDSLYRTAVSPDEKRVLAAYEYGYRDAKSLFLVSLDPFRVQAIPAPSSANVRFLPDRVFFDNTGKFAVLYWQAGAWIGPAYALDVYRVALEPPHTAEQVASFRRVWPLDPNGDRFFFSRVASAEDGTAALEIVARNLGLEPGEKVVITCPLSSRTQSHYVAAISTPSGRRTAFRISRATSQRVAFLDAIDGAVRSHDLPDGFPVIHCAAFSRAESHVVLVAQDDATGAIELLRVSVDRGAGRRVPVSIEPAPKDLRSAGIRRCGVMRDDRTAWMQIGDSLVLVGESGAASATDLRRFAKARRPEWAGETLYVTDPEQFYVGIEVGGGRRFMRVDATKLAKPR